VLLGKRNIKANKKSSSRKFIWIGCIILAAVGIGYAAIMSTIPVNAKYPVFGVPVNHYIKAVNSQNGPTFVSTSTRGGKGFSGTGGQATPTIEVNSGELVAIHILNEDHQKHNFNIDQFNVHTKDLDYFGSQSITFVADKPGRFSYYDSLNPKMSGTIVVGQ
jgi:plastocyanin